MKPKRNLSLSVMVLCLLITTLHASAFYNPSSGRWLSRDPSQEKGGINLYFFTDNSPVDRVDRNGLDTYLCFRRIDGNSDDTLAPSRLNYNLVHEFVFTTDDSGNVDNTFSWGNNGGRKGWVPDADNDKRAAQKALKNGWAVHVADKAFDALVRKAFLVLSDSPDSKHANGLIFGFNCQMEALNLIHQAELYAEMEDDG